MAIAQLTKSRAEADEVIQNTRNSVQEHIYTAQELSLLRHSLTDELSFLSQQLVSSLNGPDGQPTLLEEIETLHRNLKELQSVKGYVQVVRHVLSMRYVSYLLCVSYIDIVHKVKRPLLKHNHAMLPLSALVYTKSFRDLCNPSRGLALRSRTRLGNRSCTW